MGFDSVSAKTIQADCPTKFDLGFDSVSAKTLQVGYARQFDLLTRLLIV